MKRRRKHKLKAEINVVPYIDVMLVLLVIFMIAAPLIRQQVVHIDLPDTPADMAELPEQEELLLPLILTIDRQGNYYLNRGAEQKKPLLQEEVIALTRQTLAEQPNLSVVVEGDAGVAYEKIFEGIVLLQRGGATSVGLSGEPPAEQNTAEKQ